MNDDDKVEQPDPDAMAAGPSEPTPDATVAGPTEPIPYKIGRGKPPIHSRFEKGVSGNPGGKRKTPPTPDPKATFSRLLSTVVPYREGDKTRSATRIELIQLGLIHKALQGDPKATREVTRHMKELGLLTTAQEAEPHDHGPEIREKLRLMGERARAYEAFKQLEEAAKEDEDSD